MYNKVDYCLVKKYLKDKYKFSNNPPYLKIYKYNDTVYKIFEAYLLTFEKYEKFCIITVPSFTFPDKIILLKNYMTGYIMKYIEGTTFDNIEDDVLIINLLNSLKIVEEDIKIISKNYILMKDLHEKNIIYNKLKKTTTIIDVDNYKFSNYDSIEEIYINNIHQLRTVLKETIFYNINNKDINSIIYNYKKNSFEVFKDAIDYIQNYFNKQLYNLGNVKTLKLRR